MRNTRKVQLIVLAGILTLGLWWWLSPAPDDDSSNQDPQSPPQESTEPTADGSENKAPDLPAPDEDKPVTTVPQAQPPTVREVPIDDAPAVSNPEQAQDVVDELDLGLGPDSELVVGDATSDDYGNSYYQLEQRYKGLPVFGAQALLEVAHGQAQVLNGAWIEQIELDIEPTHSANEALRLALDRRGVPAERTVAELGTPTLLVFVTDLGPTLSWRVTASLNNPDSAPQRYLVDAHDPVIYLQEAVFQR
ncbi:hypothetical protein [Marinobacter mobilis]|uniref:Fungalysin/Thermolysin Propeptide Motif n=1 Tax=Marinobacter mobilis TaxID=488533 RepID=A0A1H3AUX5_9GAMM|nr:hypothetical protein [Marinobacter mobilis]SDX32649.1 Fungalysin/Thermolysin Propeptide Motif [Marinobacter mobilis]